MGFANETTMLPAGAVAVAATSNLRVATTFFRRGDATSSRLTFEFTRLRRLAKPAVAGRVQRRVRLHATQATYRVSHHPIAQRYRSANPRRAGESSLSVRQACLR